MTTEAERLAEFCEASSLPMAAALLRIQAAEIERLNDELKKRDDLIEFGFGARERGESLLRQALEALSDFDYDKRMAVIDAIKQHLGGTDMNLLTDEEIKALIASEESEFRLARAIEAAVIKKLATMSVEPVAYVNGNEVVRQLIWNPDIAAFDVPLDTNLFTPTALVAARVQALEEAAKVAKGAHQLQNDGNDFANGWSAAALQIEQAIRALIEK